jgi:hypothetical protein
MTITAIVHIQGEEPVVGEIDDVPTPIDVSLKISNPRKLDGKDLHYLAENVVTVIWPISRINFIEILPTREEEEVFGFVRE